MKTLLILLCMCWYGVKIDKPPTYHFDMIKVNKYHSTWLDKDITQLVFYKWVPSAVFVDDLKRSRKGAFVCIGTRRYNNEIISKVNGLYHIELKKLIIYHYSPHVSIYNESPYTLTVTTKVLHWVKSKQDIGSLNRQKFSRYVDNQYYIDDGLFAW